MWETRIQCEPSIVEVADVQKQINTSFAVTNNVCKKLLVIKSKTGCPVVEATAFVKFLANHPWILGILMIVFGAVTTFYGRRFFKWTVGILGGAFSFLFLMLCFSSFGMLSAVD